MGNFFVAALTGSSFRATGFKTLFAAGVVFAFAALGSSLGATAFALAIAFVFALAGTFTAFAFAAFAALSSSLRATALVASGSLGTITVGTVASLLHNLQLISRNFLSRALGALSLECEHYSLNCKKEAYDSSPSASSLLEAWQPSCVVGTERLESAPEAVSHVEPQGSEANEINHQHSPAKLAAKLEHDVSPAIGGIHLICAAGKNLGEHHAAPELIEVEHSEAGNHHAEGKHVLRCPFNRLRAGSYLISIVATSLLVLKGEPECIDDVNHKQCGKTKCSRYSIPVSTENTANLVVSLWAKDCHCIHQHVEC